MAKRSQVTARYIVKFRCSTLYRMRTIAYKCCLYDWK